MIRLHRYRRLHLLILLLTVLVMYPLVLLWIHYRNTPDRPGRLRAFANRWHLDLVWIGTGALFHILLAATMELGIFPWGMLALYPAWLRPEVLERFYYGNMAEVLGLPA